MLYQLAIIQKPTADEYASGVGESLVYGPVNILSRDSAYPGLVATIVAEAAAKLGTGFVWNERMCVVGTHFHPYD